MKIRYRLRPGLQVQCIDDKRSKLLVRGKIYTVERVLRYPDKTTYIYLEEFLFPFVPTRFVKAPESALLAQ